MVNVMESLDKSGNDEFGFWVRGVVAGPASAMVDRTVDDSEMTIQASWTPPGRLVTSTSGSPPCPRMDDAISKLASRSDSKHRAASNTLHPVRKASRNKASASGETVYTRRRTCRSDKAERTQQDKKKACQLTNGGGG